MRPMSLPWRSCRIRLQIRSRLAAPSGDRAYAERELALYVNARMCGSRAPTRLLELVGWSTAESEAQPVVWPRHV